MKLGTKVIDPLTGKSGFVCRIINGQAIGRDDDGNHFKATHNRRGAGRPPIAGQPCRIKVYGVPGDWMEGVRIDRHNARVTEPHPVWSGAELSATDAEIVAA